MAVLLLMVATVLVESTLVRKCFISNTFNNYITLNLIIFLVKETNIAERDARSIYGIACIFLSLGLNSYGQKVFIP